jgi:hypothetical protein
MRTGIFSLVPPNPYVISGTSTRKKDDYVSAETCQYCTHKKIWGEGSLFIFYLKMDNHGFSSVDTN